MIIAQKLISSRNMNCESNEQNNYNSEMNLLSCSIKGRVISSPLWIKLPILAPGCYRKFHGSGRFPRMVPNDEERGETVVFGGEIISCMLKYLDSVVVHITHNYPSITKIRCRNWILKLSSPATFTSKFCNKLSTQFK